MGAAAVADSSGAELAGLVVVDDSTIAFTLTEPLNIFPKLLAMPVAAIVPTPVPEDFGEHPVGSGPFRLEQWRRSSLIVLERNPAYRERLWSCEPAPGDTEGQAIAERLRGKKLPLLDRVEISIIEEAQPRWRLR